MTGTKPSRGWDIDLSQWMALVDELIDIPFEARNGLEVVLADAFQETQSYVHVVTGSLLGSGRMRTDYVDGVWTGEISYGGESPGKVNDPVVYAGFERNRGGDHDFFAPLDGKSAAFAEAMESWL